MTTAKNINPDPLIAQKIELLASEDGPIADPMRAKEIAEMEEFGIHEFRELTGVGIGNYGGIYAVSESGVTIRCAEDGVANFTAYQQHRLESARRILTLKFPCTPKQFAEWYDTTRGEMLKTDPAKMERAPSDFPLAHGFETALKWQRRPFIGEASKAVPSDQIISAFNVDSDPIANKKWWGVRFRDPNNYGLTDSRARPGKPGKGNPSYWYPLFVAGWLIEKKHMRRHHVLEAMAVHFPYVDCCDL